ANLLEDLGSSICEMTAHSETQPGGSYNSCYGPLPHPRDRSQIERPGTTYSTRHRRVVGGSCRLPGRIQRMVRAQGKKQYRGSGGGSNSPGRGSTILA